VRGTVVTLFPEVFRPFLDASVLGRARERGLVRIDLVDLRAYGEGAHRVVDDRPFGGGPGMVLMAEPVIRAVEDARRAHGGAVRTILLTPQGRRFDQATALGLASARDGFVLVCGRYEGVDERAIEVLRPEELSLGDYVLSGGEAAAITVLDATARLVPGVLGDERSPKEDSFGEGTGILDHPHYTRPVVVRGLEVPEVLRGGNHAAIAAWRRAEALRRTRERRPDLLPRDAAEA
jgi:tRNA (guanine37-N1)-methyltransferase